MALRVTSRPTPPSNGRARKPPAKPFRKRIPYYSLLLKSYWREAVSLRDFLVLLRVRLAQSQVGWIACRRPIVTNPAVRSFGGEVWLRSHTTDISVLSELIVSGGYCGVPKYASESVRLIVDLGANIGLAARWFLTLYPQATLVSVEPEPGNVSVLTLNLGKVSRKRVFPACIGARAGVASLFTTTGEFGYTTVGTPTADSIEVPIITMATALADTSGPIDILKCDIEGSEQDLFQHSEGWLARVRLLVVECHNGYTASALQRDLAANGVDFKLLEHTVNEKFRNEVAIMRPLHHDD